MEALQLVIVAHPESPSRLLLCAVLEDHGRRVLAHASAAELLADRSATPPDAILLHPSTAAAEPELRRKWPDADLVVLPGSLEREESWRDAVIQLLYHLDRLRMTNPDSRLLAVPGRND